MAGSSARTSNAPTDDTVDDMVAAILTASRVLVGISARPPAKVEETVTLTQFRTLVVLEGHGPSRLNRLAERLEVTAGLVRRVSRAPQDRDRTGRPRDGGHPTARTDPRAGGVRDCGRRAGRGGGHGWPPWLVIGPGHCWAARKC